MDYIDAQLAAFTDEELDQMFERHAYNKSQTPHEFLAEDQTLWAAVQSILPKSPPLPVFANKHGVDKFHELAVGFEDLMTRGSRRLTINKVQRSALRVIMLEYMERWLIKSKIPVSPTTIFNNLDKLEMIIDQYDAAPGYVKGGMLGWGKLSTTEKT